MVFNPIDALTSLVSIETNKIPLFARNDSCLILGSGFSIRNFDIPTILHDYNLDLLTCNLNCSLNDDILKHLTGYVSTEPFFYIRPELLLPKALNFSFYPKTIQSTLNLSEAQLVFSEISNLSKALKLFHITSFPSFFREPNCLYAFRRIVLPASNFYDHNYSSAQPISLPIGGAFTALLTLAVLMRYKRCFLLGFDSLLLDYFNNIRFYDNYSDFSTRDVLGVSYLNDLLYPFLQYLDIGVVLSDIQQCSISKISRVSLPERYIFDDPIMLSDFVKPKYLDFILQYQHYNQSVFLESSLL